MLNQGLLGRLIQSLCCLPGVGPKSAQRMAFHILQRDRQGAQRLADTLITALAKIDHCQHCRTLTDLPICEICASSTRDQSLLCVVETPADAWVVEQGAFFKGVYFILHGRLSPLDGIGPDELGLDKLEQRFAAGAVKEIILATNSTVEGEATAYYLSNLAKKYQLRASRIAQGVPIGGELEFIDSGTLSQAFMGRKTLD
ncbi:MAG: recombination protein RecR [Methylococcaceae bacterium]|nr:recombination protein RecR [Methylococcaceae bacterium]